MNIPRLATHDVLRHVLPCHEFVSQGVGWSHDELESVGPEMRLVKIMIIVQHCCC